MNVDEWVGASKPALARRLMRIADLVGASKPVLARRLMKIADLVGASKRARARRLKSRLELQEVRLRGLSVGGRGGGLLQALRGFSSN
jgi:hypothetical protein